VQLGSILGQAGVKVQHPAMAMMTTASCLPRSGDADSSLGIRLFAAVKHGSTKNPANQYPSYAILCAVY